MSISLYKIWDTNFKARLIDKHQLSLVLFLIGDFSYAGLVWEPCGCLESGQSEQGVLCSFLSTWHPGAQNITNNVQNKEDNLADSIDEANRKMLIFSYYLKIFCCILAYEYKIDNIGIYQSVLHSQKAFHLWFEKFHTLNWPHAWRLLQLLKQAA